MPHRPLLTALAGLGLVLSGCAAEDWFGEVGNDPEPWGPPVSCTSECPSGWTCLWDRCQYEEMLGLVNQARAEARVCGSYGAMGPVPPLEFAPPLTVAAQRHADTMAESGCFAHEGCGDGSACTRVTEAGYRYGSVGENIASGQDSAAEAMASWLSSEGHCSNIMDAGYQHFGAGLRVSSDGQSYYVQNFGTPGAGSVGDCG